MSIEAENDCDKSEAQIFYLYFIEQGMFFNLCPMIAVDQRYDICAKLDGTSWSTWNCNQSYNAFKFTIKDGALKTGDG